MFRAFAVLTELLHHFRDVTTPFSCKRVYHMVNKLSRIFDKILESLLAHRSGDGLADLNQRDDHERQY